MVLKWFSVVRSGSEVVFCVAGCISAAVDELFVQSQASRINFPANSADPQNHFIALVGALEPNGGLNRGASPACPTPRNREIDFDFDSFVRAGEAKLCECVSDE